MTFRDYLDKLFIHLCCDVGKGTIPMNSAIDLHLVGGAARNYYLSDMISARLIKIPKDIDLICTNKDLHNKICEHFTRTHRGSVSNSVKRRFDFDTMGYDVDLWYHESTQKYVDNVYTAADGICLSFMFSPLTGFKVCERMASKEFLLMNFAGKGYKDNHVIIHRETTKIDFGYAVFRKHIQNQGILINGTDDEIYSLYNRHKLVNNT